MRTYYNWTTSRVLPMPLVQVYFITLHHVYLESGCTSFRVHCTGYDMVVQILRFTNTSCLVLSKACPHCGIIFGLIGL